MSAAVFLDHNDFKKSKRALIAASISLFILTQLDFQSEFIEIFQLKLGVTKAKTIIFNQLAVVYLLYNFLIRASMEWSLEKQKNLLPIIEASRDKIEEFVTSITQVYVDGYKEIIADTIEAENATNPLNASEKNTERHLDLAILEKFDDKINMDKFEEKVRANTRQAIEHFLLPNSRNYLARIVAVDYLPPFAFSIISIIYSYYII